MTGWVLFAFLIGLLAGAAGMWSLLAWLGNQPERAPGPSMRAPRALPLGGVEETPDSMSQKAQRLLNELERKFEGAVSSETEAPAPKRRRARKAERSTPDEPR